MDDLGFNLTVRSFETARRDERSYKNDSLSKADEQKSSTQCENHLH